MPNGVSCAYFALKNLKIGVQRKDIFRDGIACGQAVRTADAVTKSSIMSNAVSETTAGFLNNAAKFARKIVYPLIVCSGIYNTVKSDDKVKTGTQQACGIGVMYGFEQLAEASLKKLNAKLLDINYVKANKPAQIAIYVLKGAAFASASIMGFGIGNKTAGRIIDKSRAKKAEKTQNNNNPDKNIFEDMNL